MQQRQFVGEPQPDLFGAVPPPPIVFCGNAERVRLRLAAILAEASVANQMPWTRSTLRLYETIVPQMSRWLDKVEAAEVRASFAAQVIRLSR